MLTFRPRCIGIPPPECRSYSDLILSLLMHMSTVRAGQTAALFEFSTIWYRMSKTRSGVPSNLR